MPTDQRIARRLTTIGDLTVAVGLHSSRRSRRRSDVAFSRSGRGFDSATAGRSRGTALDRRTAVGRSAATTTVLAKQTVAATTAAVLAEQAVAATAEQAMATTTTLVATAASVGVAAIAATTTTSHSLALTAQQGDADHREENRDAEHYSSIHSKFLQNSW